MQEKLWEYVSARGMDRRRFLRLLVSGGSAAVLAACVGIDIGLEQADFTPTPDSPWFKDPGPFIRHDDKGLESRLETMQGLITPTAFSSSETTRSVWTSISRTGVSPWRGRSGGAGGVDVQ